MEGYIMKKILAIVAGLLFIVLPLTAFAEAPISLPMDSEPTAYKHNEEGISQYNQGLYDIALKHFEAAAAVQPTGEVYFNEALCMDKLGQKDLAAKLFTEAKNLANGNERILTSAILKTHLAQ
jgi:Flp pilus assembly protein TadD